MELEDFYPSPGDLIQNEVDVLGFLKDQPYIKEKHLQFAQDASNQYFQKRHRQSGINFQSFLEVWHDPMYRRRGGRARRASRTANARLALSALIEVLIARISRRE